MNRGSPHTRSFRLIRLSVFVYRVIKNGFADPKSSWGFRESRRCCLSQHKITCVSTLRGGERERARQLSYFYGIIFLAPVVQRLDNPIHLINRYPADKCYKTNHAIHWIANYPVDSVIHFSNNRGQYFSITTVTNCYISICAL